MPGEDVPMTREEIDAGLAATLTDVSSMGRCTNPESGMLRLTRRMVLLVKIVEAQEQRLRALEPCPGTSKAFAHREHAWREDDGKCMRCEARRS